MNKIDEIVMKYLNEAKPQGKAQEMLYNYVQKLKKDNFTGQVELSDIAKKPDFKQMDFGKLMKSAKALEKKGLIKLSGEKGVKHRIIVENQDLSEAKKLSKEDLKDGTYRLSVNPAMPKEVLIFTPDKNMREIKLKGKGSSSMSANDAIEKAVKELDNMMGKKHTKFDYVPASGGKGDKPHYIVKY